MTCRPRNLEWADRLVHRTIQIIQYLRPPMWWIENPRHGKLSSRDVVAGIPYVDIDFCRFSTWGYQKPTRFWCSQNIASRGNVKCDGKCQNLVPSPNGGFRHKYVIGNRYREGPPQKYKQIIQIPLDVVHYLTGFSAQKVENFEAKETDWKVIGPRKKVSFAEKNAVQKAVEIAGENAEKFARKGPDCPMREVQVQPWHHLSGRPFRMGKVENRGGALQLMVEVIISVGDCQRKIRALIETGAQANLIRGNIFPDEFWENSKQPLALTTVNGEILSGGRREVQTKITFHVEPEEELDEGTPNTTWSTLVTFYDGAISCDAILGYGWLAEQRLDVLPRRDALQLHDPPRWILVGQEASRPENPSLTQEEAEIWPRAPPSKIPKAKNSGPSQNGKE